MRKGAKTIRILASMLSIMLLATACATGTQTVTGTPNAAATSSQAPSTAPTDSKASQVEMTDVGTPRAETLIVDMLNGRATNVSQMNPYLPGAVYQGNGFRQLIWEPLWDVDSINGKQIPILAEGMAEPMDGTYTKFKVKLRKGIKWSDGVDFTAEDVVFTANMLINTPELTYSKAFAHIVKSITAIDDYTIQIETVAEEKRIEQSLGVTVTDVNFKIVPKHIWEGIDVKTYQNDKCIGTGPYTLKQTDPNGNWFLYQKRADWDASVTGIIYGEPAPAYVLFRTYGTEEKRVMAAIQNDIDILCDISPESWTVLSGKNPEAHAWINGFPYAIMDDPGGRGILFNCAVAPMDDVDVRWALLLALDIKSISQSTYSGMLRVSPIILAPTTALTKVYHAPMVGWLKSFALSDGYKPFDENFAENMVSTLKTQGVEGLPSDVQAMRDIFGVGWWKYDVAESEKMLLTKGFSRNSSGKWLKPDGTSWKITLAAPSGAEVIAERMSYAIVDAWQKFGIDAVVQPCDTATFQAEQSQGTVDCTIAWPSMSVMADAVASVRQWDSSNIVEVGKNTPTGNNTGASARWRSSKVDAIIDELVKLSSDDPKVIELITEFQKELVTNVPFACMFGTSKIVPVMTHYWSGFQTSENAFEGPWWWWSNFKYSLAKYKPTNN